MNEPDSLRQAQKNQLISVFFVILCKITICIDSSRRSAMIPSKISLPVRNPCKIILACPRIVPFCSQSCSPDPSTSVQHPQPIRPEELFQKKHPPSPITTWLRGARKSKTVTRTSLTSTIYESIIRND